MSDNINQESRPLFLFGNGLSMALSPEFSLRTITQKFLSQLQGEEKEYLTELCGGSENLKFDDFEENFSQLESAYNALRHYGRFINSDIGQKFIARFNLANPQLDRHELIIKSIYNKYIFQILTLIRDKVTKEGIEKNLGNFSQFLRQMLIGKKGYVFTLNYDLLAESILLEELGTDNITDFCSMAGHFSGTEINKYDFDPAMNVYKFGNDYADKSTELHHLHGSLSLFYDYKRNKAIKFRNEDIFHYSIYQSISEKGWTLYPAIITGGGKSIKMNDYPFEFYFRNLKDICTYGKCSKLFIVGYSFRDEHVNKLIKRWTDSVEDYTDGLLIIDYKKEKTDMDNFKKLVKSALSKRGSLPDKCFEFGGANAIHDIKGAKRKEKKTQTK